MYRYPKHMPERPGGFVTSFEVAFPIPEQVRQPRPGDQLLEHKEWRRKRDDPYWNDKNILDMYTTSTGGVHNMEQHEKSGKRPFAASRINRNPTCERVQFVNDSQPSAYWKHGITCGTRVPTTAEMFPWPDASEGEKAAINDLENKTDEFHNSFGNLFRPFGSKDPREYPQFNYETTYEKYHTGAVPDVREPPIPKGWSHRRAIPPMKDTENFEFKDGAYRLRASTAPNGFTRNPAHLPAEHKAPNTLRPVSSAYQSRQMMTHNKHHLDNTAVDNKFVSILTDRHNNVSMIDTASAPDVNFRKSQTLTYQFGIRQLDDLKPVIGGRPHPSNSINRAAALRKRLFHQENNGGKEHLFDVPRFFSTSGGDIGAFNKNTTVPINVGAITC